MRIKGQGPFTTTTFKLPPQLLDGMNAQVEKDGYGKRGRSRWIREAVRGYLKSDPKLERIGVGDAVDGKLALLTLSADRSFVNLMNDTSLRIRAVHALEPGPQSLLIRTSIRYRLRNPGIFL